MIVMVIVTVMAILTILMTDTLFLPHILRSSHSHSLSSPSPEIQSAQPLLRCGCRV
jgi:hypothetical protein